MVPEVLTEIFICYCNTVRTSRVIADCQVSLAWKDIQALYVLHLVSFRSL